MVLALVLLLGLSGGALATAEQDIGSLLHGSLQYLYNAVKEPGSSDTGGDWTIICLARGGFEAPANYYARYYQSLEETVRMMKGVLHSKKYTEYSRTILGLTSIGRDPRSIGGYDLTLPLGDFNMTKWQGINGPIWALIALDSAGYPIPTNPAATTQATRQMYVDHILSQQLSDGGWALQGSQGDPDMTGMALQALSKYTDQSQVASAVERAVNCMSAMQSSNGGYQNFDGEDNVESVAQVIVALCELGIPLNDSRFVKNGNTLLSNLLSFRLDNGGFEHVHGRGLDMMATEQATYTLAAIQRAQSGRNSLYRMSDATDLTAGATAPIFRDIQGNTLNVVSGADGSVVVSKQFRSVSAALQGIGSAFTIESTSDIACVVLLKNPDGTYSRKKIATRNGTHSLSVYAGEEVVISLKGDLDGNGRVSALEARTALKASANPATLDALKTAVADIDANGKVSALEARQLLKASASATSLAW